MKTYKIIYKETLVHWFYVDAENEADAQARFEQGLIDCEFDFCDGDVADSDYEIVEEE